MKKKVSLWGWQIKAILPFCLVLAVLSIGTEARARWGPEGSDTYSSDSSRIAIPKLKPTINSVSIIMNRVTSNGTDLNKTYGSIWAYGLRCHVGAGEYSELFLAASYGHARGDPYYSDDFESNEWARLSLLPIELGFRWHIPEASPQRAYLGFSFDMAYISERNPAFRTSAEVPIHELNDWQLGYRFFVAHEWRPREGPHGLGFEFSLGSQRFLKPSGRVWDPPEASGSEFWSLSLFYAIHFRSESKRRAER